MRLGPAARVAATATGIIVVVYVLGVIALNLALSARLAQQNDNRLTGRLAVASHDPDVFSQRAPRTLRGAGDADADSAPVFFWLLDARQAVTAHSPGAPALPARPLGGQQPRDGFAVTVDAGRAGPFRLKMTREGTGWLAAGQSLAGVTHTQRLLLNAEVVAGPFLLLAMFFGCLVVGRRALAPVEQSRRRQLEFTADASHELRTPLSVIRAETDVALSTPRDVAGYRDALVRIQGEVSGCGIWWTTSSGWPGPTPGRRRPATSRSTWPCWCRAARTGSAWSARRSPRKPPPGPRRSARRRTGSTSWPGC